MFGSNFQHPSSNIMTLVSVTCSSTVTREAVVDNNYEHRQAANSLDCMHWWRWMSTCLYSTAAWSCDNHFHWLGLVKAKVIKQGPFFDMFYFTLTGWWLWWVSAWYEQLGVICKLIDYAKRLSDDNQTSFCKLVYLRKGPYYSHCLSDISEHH